MDRRSLLKRLAALGIGTTVFQRALAAQAQEEGQLNAEMIEKAEWIAGLELSDEDRESVARSLRGKEQILDSLRRIELGQDDAPAFVFQPLAEMPAGDVELQRSVETIDVPGVQRPADDESLAFMTVSQLGELIRRRQVTSMELTKLYLGRLKKYGPMLRCVVTLTEDLALQQAAAADQEIAAGKYRGPLHGIPWGAKDLIAYPGYPTTWGAPQYKEQRFDTKATVAERLDEAGAVLVAKLSLGALAMGDMWFEGRTRSPWNIDRGSSGSSAGSASATAAGCVAFALGSETLGSIVSPSRRCGTSALRPTFGRVSRAGCMPLSWTMDKIGPMTRSIQDCALIFAAIQGADGRDRTVIDRPFSWPVRVDPSKLRVGYTARRRRNDEETSLPLLAQKLQEAGAQVQEIELPRDVPVRAITSVLDVEAASMHEPLTNANETDGLNVWPGIFQAARFATAVDYVRAMRVRSRLMAAMEETFEQVDLYISDIDLAYTNLTGHPSVVLPTGYLDADGKKSPETAVITGRLYDESVLLSVAHTLQQSLGTEATRPPLDEQLAEFEKQQAQDEESKQEVGDDAGLES